MMKTPNSAHFKSQYAKHCQHLKLKGLQPKTIDAYSRAIRRIGGYFEGEIDRLSEDQLLDYFSDLLDSHSWSTVKLDLYGLKFYYQHVLKKPWVAVNLVKPPRAVRIPAIVSVDEAGRLFAATRRLRYRVFFFTLYSLGLRLGEGLRLEVGDIDAAHRRVWVRHAKGNKDRLVPLPDNTLRVLRSFWRLHRHPRWLFPHARTAGGACHATEPLERNGVQAALRRVVAEMGLKKTLLPTACATVMPPICWKPGWISGKCSAFSGMSAC